MLAAMAAPLLWLGLYPQPLFNAVRPSLAALQQRAVRAPAPVGAAMPAPATVSGSSALHAAAAQPAAADTFDAQAPGGA